MREMSLEKKNKSGVGGITQSFWQQPGSSLFWALAP
jgi:hypothetical protein